ncbi:hypothetical protein EDD16DRAFT_1646384 [Pisolithus croceorrhizus]|nr:hypothetical protein EDD16DRAFT_1646384 [Pisolithus croceorrhizus]
MADSEATIIVFVNTIRPVFINIISNIAFSACVSTLFVVLFALSTKESRRRLVFRLNVLAICLVLTMGALMGLTSQKLIFDPSNLVSINIYIATIIFLVFPPLLYDSILLTRLFALYPFRSTCGVHFYFGSGLTAEALIQDQSTDWFRSPYLIAEWVMQIADNLYTVSLFLYNLHIRTSSIKRARPSIAERIRQIFYISIANFVFPLIFNIAQIIFIMTDRSPITGSRLLLINNYVTVMGVLCATLWFSGSEWVRARNEPLPEHMLNMQRPNFGRDRITGGKSGSPIASIRQGSVPHGITGLDPGMDPKQLLTREKESRYILV